MAWRVPARKRAAMPLIRERAFHQKWNQRWKRRNAMSVAQATTQRLPLPPFTRETAIQKVRLAEDAWNSRDPEKVSLAYTVDSRWRNCSAFVYGRREIVAFLTRKWTK